MFMINMLPTSRENLINIFLHISFLPNKYGIFFCKFFQMCNLSGHCILRLEVKKMTERDKIRLTTLSQKAG